MYDDVNERWGSERGAVQIKTVLILSFLILSAVTLIKVVPVYIEQEEITHDTDELARKASLGLTAYSPEKIKKELDTIRQEHDLPEGSLELGPRTDNTAQIIVKYTRSIDFFITNYSWTVDYTSKGKGI